MSAMIATTIVVHALLMSGVLVSGFSFPKSRTSQSGESTFEARIERNSFSHSQSSRFLHSQ